MTSLTDIAFGAGPGRGIAQSGRPQACLREGSSNVTLGCKMAFSASASIPSKIGTNGAYPTSQGTADVKPSDLIAINLPI